MSLDGEKISGIRVINIAEESDDAIEKMANEIIRNLDEDKIKIVDIRFTEANIFFILGEKAN